MGANNVTVGLTAKSEEEEIRADGMRFGAASRNSSITEEDRISNSMIKKLKKNYSGEISGVSISESAGTTSVEKDGDSADINVTGVNQDFYIVGVYQYESAGTISDSSENVTTNAYIPLTTEKEIMRSDEGYTQFTIVTDTSVSSVSSFADNVEQFFSSYYASNDNYEVTTSTMESMTQSMSKMIQNVSMAIALIAGISLLVGGIGVMNIMLVSITERTREIGTRKALGATNGSIRLQFIIESVVLCLIGGCLGIFVGLLLGSVAASMLGYAATAPVAAIFIAVLFSMAVGVFFGYYPANKAARLDPIEALRYE